jgi:uncharacterized membrane protein (UPF0127 family)
MQHFKSNNLFALFILCITLACAKSETKNTVSSNGRSITIESELSFINKAGKKIKTLKVAIADEQKERNQGLMDVRTMEEDEGMLFIFEENQPLSFWMVNTPLSLDIIYVDADSTIVSIYTDTTPFSDRTLPSNAPATYVVETNAGYTLKHGITEGMKIKF